MPNSKCYHVNLKRQLVGDFAWYRCMNPDCNLKFLPGKREEPLTPWDGKLKVYYGDTPKAPNAIEEADRLLKKLAESHQFTPTNGNIYLCQVCQQPSYDCTGKRPSEGGR